MAGFDPVVMIAPHFGGLVRCFGEVDVGDGIDAEVVHWHDGG